MAAKVTGGSIHSCCIRRLWIGYSTSERHADIEQYEHMNKDGVSNLPGGLVATEPEELSKKHECDLHIDPVLERHEASPNESCSNSGNPAEVEPAEGDVETLRKRSDSGTKLCYLCGLPLSSSDATNKDHVPPRQFFPKALRQGDTSLQLSTLLVHASCNHSYQSDEDYFVSAIVPVAMSTQRGSEMWIDLTQHIDRPATQALFRMNMRRSSFPDRPLRLPGSKVVWKFDGPRVWRIVWKIMRGVFYLDENRTLPENTAHLCDSVTTLNETPPYLFGVLASSSIKGDHPDVFSYKLRRLETEGRVVWVAGLLFWEYVAFFLVFHDPDCQCEDCLSPN